MRMVQQLSFQHADFCFLLSVSCLDAQRKQKGMQKGMQKEGERERERKKAVSQKQPASDFLLGPGTNFLDGDC